MFSGSKFMIPSQPEFSPWNESHQGLLSHARAGTGTGCGGAGAACEERLVTVRWDVRAR